MGRRVIEEVYDDLDGSEGGEVQTFTFALNGTEYEIDLNEAHGTELEDALSKFVAVARKTYVPRGRKPSRTVGKGSGSTGKTGKTAAGPSTAEVREWAQGQGLAVSDRGRIASDIMVKFQEAHG